MLLFFGFHHMGYYSQLCLWYIEHKEFCPLDKYQIFHCVRLILRIHQNLNLILIC